MGLPYQKLYTLTPVAPEQFEKWGNLQGLGARIREADSEGV